MTTTTTSLTAFLLDRIAEDEAAAQVATGSRWIHSNSHGSCVITHDRESMIADLSPDGGPTRWLGNQVDADQIARHDPTRVLAECAAKRAIVDLHSLADSVYDADGIERPGVDCRECWGEFPCPTLRHLAAVYADHPDYDPAWAVS